MAESLKAGISALEFWEMTPYEVYAMVDAAIFREREEQRGRAWIAWHTAALIRQERLPRFESLVTPKVTRTLTKQEAEAHRETFEKIKQRLPEHLKGKR